MFRGSSGPVLPACSSMENDMKKYALLVFALIVVTAASAQTPQRPPSRAGEERLIREVRHELVTLPFYGVFDNLAYRVEGNTVTLVGQVRNPKLKSDAETVVKRIEGVDKVVNQLEVLPTSIADDQIRLAAYRSIYGRSPLDRYAMMSVPPIHIIVKGGRITLEGFVNNSGDKAMAEARARAVPSTFGVTNNLQTDADSKQNVQPAKK